MTEFVTHNVKRFVIEKPKGYAFTPGQATDVAIDEDKWREEKRPFTFTSHNDDLVLEFTIKRYDHGGVTQLLHELKPQEALLIDDPWGTIQYKGRGVFIAGGAGITPFIAIFRDLHRKGLLEGNTLLFANKTAKDIILHEELAAYFKDKLHVVLDEEGPYRGRINKEYLQRTIKDFKQHFYVCGPDQMVEDLKKTLRELGAKPETVVFEK